VTDRANSVVLVTVRTDRIRRPVLRAALSCPDSTCCGGRLVTSKLPAALRQ
jgi:hypothetical protein